MLVFLLQCRALPGFCNAHSSCHDDAAYDCVGHRLNLECEAQKEHVCVKKYSSVKLEFSLSLSLVASHCVLGCGLW